MLYNTFALFSRTARYQARSAPKVVGSNPTGVRNFFSFSVWAHFLSRAIAQKGSFGTFIQLFNLPHLKLFYFILYSVLFYSILFYSTLHYSILFYSILFYSILFCSVLFYSILNKCK